eukprot:COSAG02_NODE_60371_length_271_cov_0.906977_1_plen_66_part_10
MTDAVAGPFQPIQNQIVLGSLKKLHMQYMIRSARGVQHARRIARTRRTHAGGNPDAFGAARCQPRQ